MIHNIITHKHIYRRFATETLLFLTEYIQMKQSLGLTTDEWFKIDSKLAFTSKIEFANNLPKTKYIFTKKNQNDVLLLCSYLTEIYNKYIKIGSDFEINISSLQRIECNNKILKLNDEIKSITIKITNKTTNNDHNNISNSNQIITQNTKNSHNTQNTKNTQTIKNASISVMNENNSTIEKKSRDNNKNTFESSKKSKHNVNYNKKHHSIAVGMQILSNSIHDKSKMKSVSMSHTLSPKWGIRDYSYDIDDGDKNSNLSQSSSNSMTDLCITNSSGKFSNNCNDSTDNINNKIIMEMENNDNYNYNYNGGISIEMIDVLKEYMPCFEMCALEMYQLLQAPFRKYKSSIEFAKLEAILDEAM